MLNKTLYIASEFTDPCFYVNETINRLSTINDACLLLITKDIGACKEILEYCNSNNITFIAHATITGLAGTILEENVPTTEKVLQDFKDLVIGGIIPTKQAIIRIDPIVPFYSKIENIKKILDYCYDFGIRQCRISIVDYYSYVIDRMRAAQLKHANKFQLSVEDRDKIIEGIFEYTRYKGMMLYLCAENLPLELDRKWISDRGCASIYEWRRLGIELAPKTRIQRRNCTCDAEKTDLLYGLQKGCQHNCVYCYWRRRNGK